MEALQLRNDLLKNGCSSGFFPKKISSVFSVRGIPLKRENGAIMFADSIAEKTKLKVFGRGLGETPHSVGRRDRRLQRDLSSKGGPPVVTRNSI
jgi:hypothetical protein